MGWLNHRLILVLLKRLGPKMILVINNAPYHALDPEITVPKSNTDFQIRNLAEALCGVYECGS